MAETTFLFTSESVNEGHPGTCFHKNCNVAEAGLSPSLDLEECFKNLYSIGL